MEYNIENTLLTDREVEVVKQNADDKLISVLTALVNESSHTFYGDMRFNTFTNNILTIQNEISSNEELLKSLEGMSYNELRKLGSKYKIKKDPKLKLDKVLLLNEVEKAIALRINELRNKSNEYANAYTKNYKNTFEYFVNDKISKLESAITTEHNLDNLNKYKYLRDNFKVISSNLKNLHTWVDALSNPATLLVDYEEELNECSGRIKELQEGIINTYNYNEIIELTNSLKQESERKQELKELIYVQRQSLLAAYNDSSIEINFVNMRNEFLKCMLNIMSNSNEAFENGILDKNDFITIDHNGCEIDKCSRAFHSFFYEIIEREYDFRNYLEYNGIILDEIIKDKNPFSAGNKLTDNLTYSNVNDNSKIKNDEQIGDNSIENSYESENNDLVNEGLSSAINENNEHDNENQEEPNNEKDNLEQATKDLSQSFLTQANEEMKSNNSISGVSEPTILEMSRKDETITKVIDGIDTDYDDVNKAGSEDSNINDAFNVVDGSQYQEQNSDTENNTYEEFEPVVENYDDIVNEDSINQSSNFIDINNCTTRDILVALCSNTGNRIKFKVIEVKENSADKIAQQKLKIKTALTNVKEKLFTKVKEIYLNDQKKYDEIKYHFMHDNIFIKAHAKLEQIKNSIINEYNENHGGRNL